MPSPDSPPGHPCSSVFIRARPCSSVVNSGFSSLICLHRVEPIPERQLDATATSFHKQLLVPRIVLNDYQELGAKVNLKHLVQDCNSSAGEIDCFLNVVHDAGFRSVASDIDHLEAALSECIVESLCFFKRRTTGSEKPVQRLRVPQRRLGAVPRPKSAMEPNPKGV